MISGAAMAHQTVKVFREPVIEAALLVSFFYRSRLSW
jgi:hypothetical protein